MAGDFLPALAMTVVQMGYAGMNIVSKLAMDSGMDPFVHVTYRQLVATISLAPLAFFLERVVGSALIVMGLYMVIWGKKNEEKEEEKKPTIGADDGVHSEKNAELKATNDGVDHGVDFGRQITRDDMGLELSQV